MSKLIIYKPTQFNKLLDIINFLPAKFKLNYYLVCLFLIKLEIYLPTEIKKNILINLFENQKVELKNIFNWFNKYIHNPIQYINNPMVIFDNIRPYLFFWSDLDLVYGIYSYPSDNKPFKIPSDYGHIFLGIVYDPEIQYMEYIVDDGIKSFRNSEVTKYKLTNYYLYTEADILYHKPNIFDSKNKNKSNLDLISFRNIMPLITLHVSAYDIFLNIITTKKIKIKLLFGFFRNHYNIFKSNISYRHCYYERALLYISDY